LKTSPPDAVSAYTSMLGSERLIAVIQLYVTVGLGIRLKWMSVRSWR